MNLICTLCVNWSLSESMYFKVMLYRVKMNHIKYIKKNLTKIIQGNPIMLNKSRSKFQLEKNTRKLCC